MSVQPGVTLEREEAAPARTKGEIYEGIAFTFCRAATIILITQKFALPVSAGLAALFYVLAMAHGKKDTRCILRVPLLIAVFWGAISLASFYVIISSMLGK